MCDCLTSGGCLSVQGQCSCRYRRGWALSGWGSHRQTLETLPGGYVKGSGSSAGKTWGEREGLKNWSWLFWHVQWMTKRNALLVATSLIIKRDVFCELIALAPVVSFILNRSIGMCVLVTTGCSHFHFLFTDRWVSYPYQNQNPISNTKSTNTSISVNEVMQNGWGMEVAAVSHTTG